MSDYDHLLLPDITESAVLWKILSVLLQADSLQPPGFRLHCLP